MNSSRVSTLYRAGWLLVFLSTACRSAPLPALSPNAPLDRPLAINESSDLDVLDAELEPIVLEARQTYPAARERYFQGLRPDQNFYVVVRLHDGAGRFEQVFLVVDRIANGRVHGRIANEIQTVSGYAAGSAYATDEANILDWLITNPDGTEEGNYIGRYLDNRQE